MPIYMLNQHLAFPPPEGANADGIVAVGGDTSAERLILAYRQGVFPWPAQGYPLLWFSPDPRFTLVPDRAHVPRSLRKVIRRNDFVIKADTAFEQVIVECAKTPRPSQDGTWITDELIEGYVELHRQGYAHSIEAWLGGELVGALYGVSLGRGFAGESMFAKEADASKVAFVTLLGNLVSWRFSIVDCQVHTDHLARFGAQMWPRRRFLRAWREAVRRPTKLGPWELDLDARQSLDVLT